ncbi:MAG TPA: magnesium-translocating P-type ATPase [Vicinamibacterales bacterium]|nr:magnesium-translocating P-type ATPase [Vicinamibacterales bacterium]
MAASRFVAERAVASRERSGGEPSPRAYWSLGADELLHRLGSSRDGLSPAEARRRLRQDGPNELGTQRRLSRLRVFLQQLRSPLLLLLIFAAGASAATREWIDAGIVALIVLVSVLVGYSREYSAQRAADALRARIGTRATVVRAGGVAHVATGEIVRGDVVLLAAGSLVPADAVVLEAADFFVSEAVLTGESFPVRKQVGAVGIRAALHERSNCVFLGANVRSGSARCVVVATGPSTEFGAIARRLTLRPPETEFDRGIRRFGYVLTSAMTVMVLLVFGAHVLLGRAPIETLLFAVALAVGLSPELLPAILSVNLARGAQMMAGHGVLVRRLPAIENLGSMNILCTDKTGTLTDGVVQLDGAYDIHGRASELVLQLGALNAALTTGVNSPLDDAITAACTPPPGQAAKLGEIPFDFVRKRVSVAVKTIEGTVLITKGAFPRVIEVCTRTPDGTPLTPAVLAAVRERYDTWSRQGVRVLGVAQRAAADQPDYRRDDEREMTFAGFLTFVDRPKEGVAEAIAALAALGVSVKLITGDNTLVAQHIAARVGLPAARLITGRELDELHDEALWSAAERTDVFAEVDPNQKERIILSLKKMGHVVGFLGDGVNDVPAMHAADTSLSVEGAVDVAREAADFVLLERGLDVIRRGIEEGRKTFANTLKYVLITTSANLGNMASMAAASVFLPFLPLTAGQILLNNFLSDIPAVGIAGDAVDRELVDRPRRWDMAFITRYMIEFGALSSLFDVVTFAVLLVLFHADPSAFRTGWFVESLLTELLVVLVMRTRRPFFRSRPGRLLLLSTTALIPITFALPYAPFAAAFGFVPLPAAVVAAIGGIACLYVAATELQKQWFYRATTGVIADGA